MKKLFLSLVALIIATVSYAQNSLVATLSHENGVQMFYGPSALANAVDAAVSGDVITLSGGSFKSAKINITKGITIRGTGAEAENPTIINSNGMDISVPTDDNNHVIIQGAIITLSYGTGMSNLNIFSGNLYMIKCIINPIMTFGASSSVDAKFVNCNIQKGITQNGSSNVKFFNCKVDNFNNGSSTNAMFFNCYLLGSYLSGNNISGSSFVNCILQYYYPGSAGYIPADASAMNCLFINYFLGSNVIDCYQVTNKSEVFETTDKLSDEAKTKYLGTDGTEVGLYGGQYPYDLTPLYPQITKLNVAKQATADNKLSVEVEVSANE